MLFLSSFFLWPTMAIAAPNAPTANTFIIANDMLFAPDADFNFQNQTGASALAGVSPDAPGYYQSSEYMIGDVAVGLIFPESNGSHDSNREDWTDAEMVQVQSEIQDALDWWAGIEPAAHLNFTVESHLLPTGYEPITHPQGEEGYWIGETMAALGFENGDFFSAVRDYINDLRDRTGSDWAFAIFVVDSSADSDGSFYDRYFAYAYFGGPFMVMTYDNSGYGINNMDAVAAHEIGHIFRARDQYPSSGQHCDLWSGYLNAKNGNSQAGGDCQSNESSIMRGGIDPYRTHSVDYFARGQIGWWDTNANGVLDPVDAAPQLDASLEDTNDGGFSFSGQAWQEPVASSRLPGTTIVDIATVDALVDDTTWVSALAQDGHFDTLTETFELEVESLSPGLHTVAIQATNSEGLVSTFWFAITLVSDPVDGELDSLLTSRPEIVPADRSLHFEGIAAAAYGPDTPSVTTVQFSVDGDEWQDTVARDGAFDSPIEDFDITLTNLPEGPHSLSVRTIDSNGKIETNVETHPFQAEVIFSVYLPMVQR
ncbi:MAG: hypothetical protein GY832_16890 [Chloroflexi bacterium]|nr:hypothetical protein [Chloroflexota bacterium]